MALFMSILAIMQRHQTADSVAYGLSRLTPPGQNSKSGAVVAVVVAHAVANMHKWAVAPEHMLVELFA
jgi:hypothetical protein